MVGITIANTRADNTVVSNGYHKAWSARQRDTKGWLYLYSACRYDYYYYCATRATILLAWEKYSARDKSEGGTEILTQSLLYRLLLTVKHSLSL